MAKAIMVLVMLVCLCGVSFSQNPFYDALNLGRIGYVEDDGKISFELKDSLYISAILRKYADTVTAYPGLVYAFGANPFLRLPMVTSMSSAGALANISKLGGGFGALSSIGGLDVTNIASGLAGFLVKRTKTELNVAFFTRFRDVLNKPQYADLKILFPNTWELLDAIGDEIYDYNRYIQNLREAFISDIITLDEHLPGIIPNHEDFFSRHFGLSAGLRSACYVTTSLKYRIHPGDILDGYPVDYLVNNGDTIDKNLTGAIQTLQLISGSLRDTASGDANYWVGAEQIRKLVNDRKAFRIWLGLVWQVAGNERYNGIPYKTGSFRDLLGEMDINKDLPAYRDLINGFAWRVGELSELVSVKQKPANDSASFERFAQYFRSAAGLLEYGARVTTLPHFNGSGEEDAAAIDTYFRIIDETAGLAVEINRKNYSSAVNHAVTIYNLILTKPAEKEEEASKEMLRKLSQYGAFMASVAAAKTPDEVQEAIESAALPAGSSRIKRETPFNVSLNAYTGLFVGYERITSMGKQPFEINSYGVAAPVGVAISTGGHSFLCLFPKNEGHWSYSAFISLIDIGAVASFRFQNDSVSQVPTIQLQDIFSPGLFLSVGIPKCPLSVNLGAQVGPNLRSVNVPDGNGNMVNKYQNNLYWRFSLSLVVDIPIFNFYTRSKD